MLWNSAHESVIDPHKITSQECSPWTCSKEAKRHNPSSGFFLTSAFFALQKSPGPFLPLSFEEKKTGRGLEQDREGPFTSSSLVAVGTEECASQPFLLFFFREGREKE